MSSFFAILFVLSLILLVWGLISPKSLSKEGKKPVTRKDVGVSFGILTALFFILTGVTAPPQENRSAVDPNSNNELTSQQQISSTPAQQTPAITKQTITENKSMPFDKKTVKSSSLSVGTSKITTPGLNGEKILTYEVTYMDGKRTSKNLIKEEVATEPITQITTIGTYATPVHRSKVSSPSVTRAPSSNPSGATAKCRDGTYSYSQSRRGTCSHHGGVAIWL